jgi:Holliday junction resolvasome RuvABC endonuclease subunit
MRILALDPATKCGWAHTCGACGTWDLSVRRDESSGMRLLRLRGKLDEIKRTVGVDVLVYEAARNAAPKMQGALVIQATLQGVIQLWCVDNSVDYRGYSPTELKKHATGKGNAPKQAMIDYAKAKWADASDDDNECDARWLLDLALSELPAERGAT